PNIEAVAFLVERIVPLFPHVRFRIPGSQVPDAFLRSAPANVSFPGYVPDTRILYHRPNTIVAAPLFSGTGQRVKLLEAFSMACPVITTSIGALGFPIHPGREALIADTAQEFREALRQLASSEALRIQLGNAGREMIVRHFDWSDIGNGLLEIVNPSRTR